jgi:hypothetical protein
MDRNCGCERTARKHAREYRIRAFALAKFSASIRDTAALTRNELLHVVKLADKLITVILGEKADTPAELRRARVGAHVLAALMLPTSRLAVNANDTTGVVSAAAAAWALPRRATPSNCSVSGF